MSRTTVVLAEQPLLTEALARLLASSAVVSVVGTAVSAADVLHLVSQAQPDALVIGDNVSPVPLLPTIRQVKALRPETEIIVLACGIDERRAFAALTAGASGYILQDISAENFVKVIAAVARGRAVVHPDLLRRLVRRLSSSPPTASSRVTLTTRERGILAAMIDGSPDKIIAQRLRLGETTVKTHVRSILKKLGARNRTEAVFRLLTNLPDGQGPTEPPESLDFRRRLMTSIDPDVVTSDEIPLPKIRKIDHS